MLFKWRALMKQYWLISIMFLTVLASPVFGTVIHGSVYDLELNILRQAVVEIDTLPRQLMVSQNGSYAFSVPPGSYVITARQSKLDLVAAENITVSQEGEYVLDLILFPDLSPEEGFLNETLDVPEYDEPPVRLPVTGIVLLVLAVLAGLAWWYWKKRARPAPVEKKVNAKADLEEILAFVRKEGGRTTQKDLRRAIPYSEAKISLMITELESQGKLKKIKKGRGNILVLP